MGTRIGSLLVRMGLATDEKSFDSGKKTINKFSRYSNRRSSAISKSFMRMGGAITGAFAIGSVVKNAASTIGNFEQSVANLSAITGKSASQMSVFSDAAKEIGGRSAFSASQVVLLQTELAKLGFSEKEILNSTEAVGNLSIALGTDAASAAAFAGASLRSFGIDASDTESVMDLLAKATTRSALDFEKLNVGLSIVGPVAKAANVDIARTTSILGVLADRGLDASTAGTSLRNIYLELAASGMTYEEAMQEINQSQNKLNTANELFGKRGATTALILAENSTAVDTLDESLRTANGTLETMTEKRLNTLQGKLTLLQSSWEKLVLSIESGDGFFAQSANSLLDFADSVITAVTPVKDLTKQVQKEYNVFNRMVGVLKNVESSDSSRASAIKRLKSDYPDYIKNLDLESATLEELNKIQKEYNDQAAKKYKEAKKQTELNRLLKEQAELQGYITDFELGESTILNTLDDWGFESASEAVDIYRNKLEEVENQIRAIREEQVRSNGLSQETIDRLSRSHESLDEQLKKLGLSTDKQSSAFISLGDQLENQKKVVEGLEKSLLGLDGSSSEYYETVSELNKEKAILNELTKKSKGNVEKLAKPYKNLSSRISESNSLIKQLTEEYILSGSTDSAKLSAIQNEIEKRDNLNNIYTASINLQKRLEEASDSTIESLQNALNLKDRIFSGGVEPLDALPTSTPSALQSTSTSSLLSGESGGSALQAPGLEVGAGIAESSPNEGMIAEILGIESAYASLNEEIAKNYELLAKGNELTPEQREAAKEAIELAEAQKKAEIEKGLASIQSASDAVNAARQFVKAKLSEFIAAQLVSLASAGPLGLLAAGAIVGTANSLFDKFIPKLANGGIIDSPTFAMLGEYPGAKNNVEIATPEKLLRKIVREEGGGMGGRLNININAIAQGDDLRYVVNRAEFQNGRV